MQYPFSTGLGDQAVVDIFGAAGIYLSELTTGGMFLCDGKYSIDDTNNMVGKICSFGTEDYDDYKLAKNYNYYYEYINTGYTIPLNDPFWK